MKAFRCTLAVPAVAAMIAGLLFGALLSAASASAQGGNQSDVTGTVNTSGDVAGGVFTPAGVQLGTRPTFVTSFALSQVVQTSALLQSALGSGSLPSPLSSRGATAALSSAAQTTALGVLQGGSGDRDPAAVLVARLRGLLPVMAREAPAGADNRATRLLGAVNACNAFVLAASPEFLQAPPDEFLAVHVVLTRLVAAARPN